MDTALNGLKGVLGLATNYVAAKNPVLVTRSRTYKDIVHREGGVFIIFGEIREDVSDFLKQNDFPIIEKSFDEARVSLDSFAKTVKQKEDAGDVAEAIVKALNAHFKTT